MRENMQPRKGDLFIKLSDGDETFTMLIEREYVDDVDRTLFKTFMIDHVEKFLADRHERRKGASCLNY